MPTILCVLLVGQHGGDLLALLADEIHLALIVVDGLVAFLDIDFDLRSEQRHTISTKYPVPISTKTTSALLNCAWT